MCLMVFKMTYTCHAEQSEASQPTGYTLNRIRSGRNSSLRCAPFRMTIASLIVNRLLEIVNF